MPPRKTSDASPPLRRQRGFEAAALLVADRIRAAGQSRGFAIARLLTHWEEVVGPEIARIARPQKVGQAARRGDAALGATLTLLVSPAHAPVVQMQIPRIRERVNACYGHAAIGRILLTQTGGMAFGLSEAPAAFSPAPRAPEDIIPDGPALALTEGIADPGLRDALARLATRVMPAAGDTPPAPSPARSARPGPGQH